MLMNNSINNAFSIQEFCDSHSFSRAKFYLLVREHKAPRLMRIGRRRLISIEAATEWRRQMEKDSELIHKTPEKLPAIVVPAPSVSRSLKKRTDYANNQKPLKEIENG